jgi:hypothetical protein
MAFFMIKMMVKRVASNKYEEEIFTCDSVHQTTEDVVNKLHNDNSVIDFYQTL